MSIIKNPEIIAAILEQIQEIEEKNDNLGLKDYPVLRDKIFEVLEADCTVLYFPCDEEENWGFYMPRYVAGVKKNFVYINTAKNVEKQVFAAAHELGHVWDIIHKIEEKHETYKELLAADMQLKESIINRFAAELLMPETLFVKAVLARQKELTLRREENLGQYWLNIIIYLMNYFLAPYRAVVKRLVEVKKIDGTTGEAFLSLSDDIVDKIVEASPYQLLGVKTQKKEMGRFKELLDYAEEKNLRSGEFCDRYRELMDIIEIEIPEIQNI